MRVRPVADVSVSLQTETSQGVVRTGWVITGFIGLFLLVDGGARVAGFAPYVEGMTKFGYSASLATPVGLALLASTIVMLIPRTAGTRLHPRHRLSGWRNRDASAGAGPVVPVPGSPRRISWLGLYLRDARLRDLLPFARSGLDSRDGSDRGEQLVRVFATLLLCWPLRRRALPDLVRMAEQLSIHVPEGARRT